MEITKGLGIDNIYEQTLYVEDAVEEWCNSRNRITENTQNDRLFSQMTLEVQKEIFYELKLVVNAVFDYGENPEICAKFEESIPSSKARFMKAFGLIHEIAGRKENFDRIYVFCTHGVAMQAIVGPLDDWRSPGYCGVNLLTKDLENSSLYGRYLFKRLLANFYAYKKD